MRQEEREAPSRKFGDASLCVVRDEQGALTLEGGLRGLAFSHGCPIPDLVEQEYGAAWALARYASCNFVYKHIILGEAAAKPDQTLFERLHAGLLRAPGELPPPRNPAFVPPDYHIRMCGMGTPWGYAAPRIFLEQLGDLEAQERAIVDPEGQRFDQALRVLENAVSLSEEPIPFLVRFAEGVVEEKADRTAVLSHLLSLDFYREENCPSVAALVRQEIELRAPRLWRSYCGLSVAERRRAGIF
ncbi:MAG: hypothetical protein J0M12_14140 [Deltaproteobacteria bacterium]|nr:hypothetical protein [Deltaproteobacteria bacterium]